MAETSRTFFAIEVTEPARQALEGLRTRLEPLVPNARWVKLSNMHLTLAFLGDIATSRLDELDRRATEAIVAITPFSVKLKGLGAFPSLSRPRVLWAGLAGNSVGQLQALQQAVAQAARLAGCPPADERFSPHVTLARFKMDRGGMRPPDLNRCLADYLAWEEGELRVSEVVLYESILEREGPSYKAIHRVSLRAEKPEL